MAISKLTQKQLNTYANTQPTLDNHNGRKNVQIGDLLRQGSSLGYIEGYFNIEKTPLVNDKDGVVITSASIPYGACITRLTVEMEKVFNNTGANKFSIGFQYSKRRLLDYPTFFTLDSTNLNTLINYSIAGGTATNKGLTPIRLGFPGGPTGTDPCVRDAIRVQLNLLNGGPAPTQGAFYLHLAYACPLQEKVPSGSSW